MNKKIKSLYFLASMLAGVLCSTAIVNAYQVDVSASVLFNNDNINVIPQPKTVSQEFGDFNGETHFALEGGKTLIMYPAYIQGIKLYRFELDNAYWWVSDKGIIWGTNTVGDTPMAGYDLQALSIYLTL
jgi:hypothetical protein